jgi:hypothetical protein
MRGGGGVAGARNSPWSLRFQLQRRWGVPDGTGRWRVEG